MIMSKSELFADTWLLWASKGHDPIEKVKLLETPDGIAVGILDYITLDKHLLLRNEAFDSYEDALSNIGRAIDAAIKKDN